MARGLLLVNCCSGLYLRVAFVLMSLTIDVDGVNTLLFYDSERFRSIVPGLAWYTFVYLLCHVDFRLAIYLLNWAGFIRSNLGWNSYLVFQKRSVFLIQQSARSLWLDRCWGRVGDKGLFDSCFRLWNLAVATVATSTPAHKLAFWWVCVKIAELLMSLWGTTWQRRAGRVVTA